MTIEDKLRTFIMDELHFDGPPEVITSDYPLLANRVIDSMGMFQMVTFLESEYGIEIADEELVPEHFGSLEGISNLVKRKGEEG